VLLGKGGWVDVDAGVASVALCRSTRASQESANGGTLEVVYKAEGEALFCGGTRGNHGVRRCFLGDTRPFRKAKMDLPWQVSVERRVRCADKGYNVVHIF